MKNLTELRAMIEAIDDQMLDLFKQRMNISKDIGQLKKEQHLPVFDPKREKALFDLQKQKLNNETLWPFYLSFYKHLISLSKEIQQ
ncbi:MAG: chorismate mutase [Acholeplasmataceae bacterium]